MRNVAGSFIVAVLLSACLASATETENLGIQVLPAPGKVVIDGKADDWDLTGGVFACGDVEHLRDKLACWFHLMYDAENLYLLARWLDETPMNNPGSSRGDYGFAGDCLQARVITAPDTPQERCTHVTAWLDRDGIDVVHFEIGRKFDGGTVKDAQALGAAQEFSKNPDGKGYVQEIAIPWKLLCKEGVAAPKAGDQITVTLEPNFCTEARFRITIKDIFKAGVVPDRVFTFMGSSCWGTGTLEAKGNVAPRKLRLADGREFTTTMQKGIPVIDWTGLIKVKELQGFEEVTFRMPEDGFISLNIRSTVGGTSPSRDTRRGDTPPTIPLAEGCVVRQLLNCEFRTKGRHTVKWDGLTTPNWRRPGEPVPAGTYTWDALWHKGIGLRLVGWAHNGGSAPWDGPSGKTNWGGDHGVPFACDADKDKVYLGWSGAEAGKALVACDLDGAVQWKLSRGGMSGAELVTVDGGTVYAMNWDGLLFR
ncbi:MAG: hypothetical protein FJ291_25735, partial [Planctomycetes bacterium]|nr:hypothetical protein [Planctomycetota bacterium]